MEFKMMCSQNLLLFFLIFASACSSDAALYFPKMGLYGGLMQRESFRTQGSLHAMSPSGFQIMNYTQTLDHFNYRPDSYATFQQRYAINFNYWGGANTSSPIFVYTGDEGSLDGDLYAGFLTDNAPQFKALLVFIEHRYYGLSVPFGSWEETYNNASTLGYFSSSQALADYAQLIIELKKNLSAQNCPVIAMGGSYGGMLAAWFRLKYPHIAIGAFASSAPILYFDDITPQNGYMSVATKDFREASESCYQTIKQSWSEIDKLASQPNGLAQLSQKFKTCSPLNSSEPLKDFLDNVYEASAQYDDPWRNPVDTICKGIDNAPQGTDVLGRIVAGLEAIADEQCYDVSEPDYHSSQILMGWTWQVCTEMVMPIGCGDNDTMFQAQPFDLHNFTKACQKLHGASVTPRPHWITTEFGGHNIKSALETFGSNIIFSNGLKDPYSSGGVLFNISDSIVAIYTDQGSHCLDILSSTPSDPQWLTSQRNAEIKIIEGWIAQYNATAFARTNVGVTN